MADNIESICQDKEKKQELAEIKNEHQHNTNVMQIPHG